MAKPLVVVTGSKGQLGQEIQRLHTQYKERFDFLFTNRQQLDLNDINSIPAFFQKHRPAYFINCAAYTAVDKAETEQDAAYRVNAEAVGIIAQQCALISGTLILVSTDYVFAGTGNSPYTPGDETNPVNYYGYTKWLGEKLATENNPKTIVIRTSWLYSATGNNFVKTMLRLMNERAEISVVADQIGSPTYAADLATAIMQVISLPEERMHYGIYHFSNKGNASWYDFAVAIKELAGMKCTISPIPTTAYPTPAKRPAYSVMDNTSFSNDYGIQQKAWKQSLQACLQQLL
jgi:dTDP-4-dehydrorhamnose reductase